jgi:hypothetical protein
VAQEQRTTQRRQPAATPKQRMPTGKKVLLVGGAVFLLSGVIDSRGGVPLIGHPECEAQPVTSENMLDPTMPWLPNPATCPEFYEGREGVVTGPPIQIGPGAPPIDPSDAAEFAEWGGPWYMEGPSCWTTTDC